MRWVGAAMFWFGVINAPIAGFFLAAELLGPGYRQYLGFALLDAGLVVLLAVFGRLIQLVWARPPTNSSHVGSGSRRPG